MALRVVTKVLLSWLFWHVCPAPTDRQWGWSGRVIETQDWHVGVRVHTDGIGDGAITLQVSTSYLP